jgi:hypothetical protein
MCGVAFSPVLFESCRKRSITVAYRIGQDSIVVDVIDSF